jgi:hypothetical protein
MKPTVEQHAAMMQKLRERFPNAEKTSISLIFYADYLLQATCQQPQENQQ